jgi:predicted alpha/beta-fold hydrolase
MPLIPSLFKATIGFRAPTIQTVLPALFRNPNPQTSCHRHRLHLADSDFIDFDHYPAEGEKLAIISHGLEGNSKARYVRGMVRILSANGYDVITWNMRGCSGQLNNLLPSYHSGFTQDLEAVLTHALSFTGISKAVLIGFSVGGNLTLKLLGELGDKAPTMIRAAVTFSVPTNLGSSAEVLARPYNRIYMNMFLRSLCGKLRAKEQRQPGVLDLTGIERIRTFREYDSRFIAPLFGFKSAQDYWTQASSEPFLPKIRVPTLLLTSRDDPFLDPITLPIKSAENSEFFHLEVSEFGGHVGFMNSHPWGDFYSEQRALGFFEIKD